MTSSLIIARVIGPLLTAVGLGMLINHDAYFVIGQQFLGSLAIIYLSGIIILLIGLFILNSHNVWARDWRSVITVVGWLFTTAGIWRLIAPQFVPFVGGAILQSANFFIGAGVLLICIGGLLTYKGYVSAVPHPTERQQ